MPADLSDTAQLQRLSDFLPAEAVVVTSDLIRASATGDAIQGARNRLPDSAEIREFSFGRWDGCTFDEVAHSDPVLSRTYWEEPGDIRPPGGESWNDAALRIKPFVDRLNRDHTGKHIVAVAHIGVIMTQIERASGEPPGEVIGHRIDNLSVTRLTYGSTPSATLINHIP